MSRGQPDFYSAQVPSMGVYGEGQTSFLFAADADIDGGGEAIIAAYTVLAGYELHFMGGAMTSNFPGIILMEIFVNAVPISPAYFDMTVTFPLHPAAAYVVTAGYTISFLISNLDNITHHFAGGGVGFLLKVAE